MELAEDQAKQTSPKLKFVKRDNDWIDAVQCDRWIEHPAALSVLDQLNDLFSQDRKTRPQCAMIVGESNSGKTTIGRQLQYLHRQGKSEEASVTKHPIVFVETPPGPFLTELYGGLLRAVNAPTQMSWSRQRREAQILDLFPRLGVKMIIVDEIHNILPGSRDQRMIFMNGLKFLTNSLRIPIIVIGTRQAESAFQTDQQFGSRFEPIRVPNWKPDKDYATFIMRFINSTGFKASNEFLSKSVIQNMHAMTNGLTGETLKLLRSAMMIAIRADEEELTPSMLSNSRYTAVHKRRGTSGK